MSSSNIKELDRRVLSVIKNGHLSGHRSQFVIVGDNGRNQVAILHDILSKVRIAPRPSVLWCYHKDLGFTTHRKKRNKEVAKKMMRASKRNDESAIMKDEDDMFELFVSSTRIRYCYYKQTHTILGNTFGVCVLQDFEYLTPNLLARTIETVEGGGLVIFLLRTMKSLRELYTLSMDVHDRYRTEAHQDIAARFNERFLLSLTDCKSCMVVDDELNILPISSHMFRIEQLPATRKDELSANDAELQKLKDSLQDTQPVHSLVTCCKTLDQARAVLKFLDAVTEKTLRSTVSLTAARGRGKSAALGLAIAGAVTFGYSNIFVTSPSPENLKTLFEFIFKGLDSVDYQEHTDYQLIKSTNPEFNNAIVRVNIFRDHRQTIQYIHPSDGAKLGQAELVVIDEAAAIPLPFVKQLLGPYLVFMASTINGYEGTGRSLSLKLLQQLREQSSALTSGGSSKSYSQKDKDKELLAASGRTLHEISLEESIRYEMGDPVESWLNTLLCLDVANVPRIYSGCPPPADCDLYYVNRDTLFSFHKASEAFLHRLMSIYVAAHYKNTPNDLQMISDAPAHQLFVLLGPVDQHQSESGTLPEILCVVQICLEGEISKSNVINSLSRGKRASGDLIPWTVAQQFQDNDFPTLSGARVVRIATHPDFQYQGYGKRAMYLLKQYYEGKIACLEEEEEEEKNEENNEMTEDTEGGLLEEKIKPRRNLPPLLAKLSERRAERLDWLGVSYGITYNLLRFWKSNGFVPVYLRQTANDLTGEHSCIMLKSLSQNESSSVTSAGGGWLVTYWKEFRRRFLSLLSYQFSQFAPSLAMALLEQKCLEKDDAADISRDELLVYLSNYDIKRLELYGQNLVDYHLITDLLPAVARLYFSKRLGLNFGLKTQSAIILGLGLQHRTVDQLAKDLEMPAGQILALLNRSIRKVVKVLNDICERTIAAEFSAGMMGELKITEGSGNKVVQQQTLDEELREGAEQFEAQMEQEKTRKKKQQKQLGQCLVDQGELTKFAIRGTEDDWEEALVTTTTSTIGGKSGLVSVKRKGDTSSNLTLGRPTPESVGLAGRGNMEGGKQRNKKFKKQKDVVRKDQKMKKRRT